MPLRRWPLPATPKPPITLPLTGHRKPLPVRGGGAASGTALAVCTPGISSAWPILSAYGLLIPFAAAMSACATSKRRATADSVSPRRTTYCRSRHVAAGRHLQHLAHADHIGRRQRVRLRHRLEAYAIAPRDRAQAITLGHAVLAPLGRGSRRHRRHSGCGLRCDLRDYGRRRARYHRGRGGNRGDRKRPRCRLHARHIRPRTRRQRLAHHQGTGRGHLRGDLARRPWHLTAAIQRLIGRAARQSRHAHRDPSPLATTLSQILLHGPNVVNAAI